MVWMTGVDDELVVWLLEGDPSIRWRVHRDLLGSSSSTVSAERARVATEGWGAKLISLQDPDGRWDGGDYSPKWTSTTYTLLHLAWLGLLPRNHAALAGCERLGSGRAPGAVQRPASSRSWYGSPLLTDTTPSVLTMLSAICSANSSTTAAGTARHGVIVASTALSTQASWPLRPSTPISKLVAGWPPKRRRHEGGSFSCAIGCTSPIAPAKWQSVPVRASPSCPSGTSTCCAGLSTSQTWAPTRTNGWATRLPLCDVPVDRTGGGRRTQGIPAVPGFGWRNRVRAGGTPCECCVSWIGGTRPAEQQAATCDTWLRA
jgi:hypothetical protein